ncbi:MAG TPA: sulfurtransferase [Candidatus Limnocylindria bacterium]|nr:sulfurtransferase [Candidatus Limnocylindria bacterium]
MAPPLISADRLAKRLEGEAPPLILDVQFVLGDPNGSRTLYERAHLPGAVFCDLDTVLAGPVGPTGGRHPLPEPERLQRDLRALGLNDASSVVTYDEGAGMGAARAWWVLRWIGHDDVQILDGGLPAWVARGGAIESGSPLPLRAGDIRVEPGHMPLLRPDDAAALARAGVLLDARAAPRYRGEVEPIDPVAGHIPGARNLPVSELVDASGRYLAADELRRRFAAVGVEATTPVGAYCGSGVSAAQEIVALTLAGYQGALYAGSWSDWISDRRRPIATGE